MFTEIMPNFLNNSKNGQKSIAVEDMGYISCLIAKHDIFTYQ